MTATTFNAITYANKLKNAGVEPRAAEAIAEEQSNILHSTVATKNDLSGLKNELLLLEARLHGFMVKCIITTVGLIGGYQTILHFFQG